MNAAAAVNIASQGQLGIPDFLRWARDNGYLSPRFWIDGGAIALIPKLIMVIGSYLWRGYSIAGSLSVGIGHLIMGFSLAAQVYSFYVASIYLTLPNFLSVLREALYLN